MVKRKRTSLDMGQNQCKKLGVKPGHTIGRKTFDMLWRSYTPTLEAISQEQAKKFLVDFASVCNVPAFDDAAAAALLAELRLKPGKRVTRRAFERLFAKAATATDTDLSESLVAAIDGDDDNDDDNDDGDDDDDEKDDDEDDGDSSASTSVKKPVVAAVLPPKHKSPPTLPSAAGWYYTDDSNVWQLYDAVTSRLLNGSLTSGQKQCALNHGRFAQRPADSADTKKSSGGAVERVATGARVEFGPLLEISRATGQSRHVCCVPKPSAAAYGAKPAASAAAADVEAADDAEDEAAEKKRGMGFAGASAKAIKSCQKLTGWKTFKNPSDDDECAICMCPLASPVEPGDMPMLMSRCAGNHGFHRDCIVACRGANEWLQCPVCSAIYGVRTGPMPSGSMRVSRTRESLPGQKGGTITIHYHFPSGVQDSRHPHPGVPYDGTSRTAYLPDNSEGNTVLKLFEIAWERKLLFRVGMSITNGTDNQVVWAGIHHKTSTSSSEFGYPDPTYLTRVKEELAVVGVRLDDIKK